MENEFLLFCRRGSDKKPWILIFALCKISTDLKIYPFWYVKWLALVMSVKSIEMGTNLMLCYSLLSITLCWGPVFILHRAKMTQKCPQQLQHLQFNFINCICPNFKACQISKAAFSASHTSCNAASLVVLRRIIPIISNYNQFFPLTILSVFCVVHY